MIRAIFFYALEIRDPAGWRLQKLSFELEVISFVSATETILASDLKLLLGDYVTDGSRSTAVLVVSSLNLAIGFNYFLRAFAAFLAARDRDAAERFLAALRAWRDKARFEAAL